MKAGLIVFAASAAFATVAVHAADPLPARGEGRKAALEAAMLANGGGNAIAAGGTCATPTAFTATPYNDTGTTVGATDVISALPGGCSNYTFVEGPEAIYSFVAGAAANLTFTVTANGDYDTSIYLVSTCNSGATCITGSDSTYYGAETFTTSALTNGTTYYLHIDSYYPASDPYGSGTYSLAVTGTLPVNLQEFSID